VCFLGPGVIFTGDTIFAAGDVGRTDYSGGSAESLRHSIQTKLLPLPAETVVYPGHAGETTLGEFTLQYTP
jgi:hydroxyacylglutathione hydrolase